MPVYATAAQYAASPYGETPAPADIDNRLARASQRVDELLFGAVYDVDADDLPTNPGTAAALASATCAQARYTGDDRDSTGRRVTSASIGSASVSFDQGDAPGDAASVYAPYAVSILRTAGLLPAILRRVGG